MISTVYAAGTTCSLTCLSAVQPRRKVAVSGIREYRDDHAALDRGRQTAHGPEGSAARVAYEEALGSSNLARQVVGGLGRTSPHLVGKLGSPDPGHDRGRQVLQA